MRGSSAVAGHSRPYHRRNRILRREARPGIAFACEPSTEGERVGLGSRFQELDLEAPIIDRPRLPNDLIEPLSRRHAPAFGIDVGSMGRSRRSSGLQPELLSMEVSSMPGE